MRLEDASDLFRVRHGATLGRLRNTADLAADRFGPRRRDRPPGEDRIEGVDQVVPGGRGSMDADGVLVVDPASVDHGPRLIQDEDFGRPLGPEVVGQAVADVLQDREWQSMLLGEPADRDRPILLVGVDAEEADTSLPELAGELGEPRGIGLGEGTLGPDEGQDDDLSVAGLIERVPGSPVVLESETDRRLRRFARPDQADQRDDPDPTRGAHRSALNRSNPLP